MGENLPHYEERIGPDFAAMELLKAAGFQLSELPETNGLGKAREATKTVTSKSGVPREIKVEITAQNMHEYKCMITVPDFDFKAWNHDFNVGEVAGNLANAEKVAYFEQPLEKYTGDDPEDGAIRTKYRDMTEQFASR